jgi:large subunit ribosomal protein L23
MTTENIIGRPVITEKGTHLVGNHKYIFFVKSDAVKPEIKKAIKKVYKVDPIKVNIILAKGKVKRVGRTKKFSKISDYKKAIVTIKKDQKIEGFESVKE